MVGDKVVDYDYLVLATGPKLAFDEIEGLGPDGHSVCFNPSYTKISPSCKTHSTL
jgi:sulfide:quinone oxidoreductase